MTPKLKKIIIIIVVGILAFFAYSAFKPDPTSTSLLRSQTRVDSTNLLGAEIIKAINQINSLELDRSVFDDPIFQTLVDRSQEINPEPVGRPNPFAPIGSTGGVQVQTQAQTETEPGNEGGEAQ